MNNKPLNNTTPTFNNKVVVSGNKVVSKEKIRYKYIAFDKNGKQIKGYFDAFRKSDVESFLTVQGYKIAEIKPTKITKIGKFLTFSNEMRYKELTFFLTQLSTYIKSGITLADTIAILEKQTNKKKNKELFKRISYELNTGANFSEALARQGNVFPKLLINMLKASELTGNLTETLDDMAAYYKTADSNRKQIISALTYPSVVLVIAIIVLTFLLIFVVPQFESIFEQLGSKLPGITVFLISLSAFIQKNIIKIVLALAAIIIIIIIAICARDKKPKVVVKTDNVNDENIANKVKQYIPNFNKQEFLNNGYQIYKDVQNAWMNFKLDDVKDVITDEIYNMYDSQLSTLEVKGEKNIMKDFKLVKSYLKDVNVQNETITITTGYVIEMYDYIIEESTGKVLRGSSTNKLRIVYEMKFRQTLNSNGKVDHCPNCGAKIEMNSSGICEYCGSKLVSENAKWVLTEKKTMRQEMF